MSAALPLPDAAFLHRLADAADSVTLPAFRAGIDVVAKSVGAGDFDPVTEADKGAERAMRDLIRATYPEHGIAGEEYADYRPDAANVWHLDPIDGTRQFVTGVPLWGTLAGLVVDGSPHLGMVSHPFTRERFWAVDGQAMHRDSAGERPIRTRSCTTLADAALFTTTPHLYRDAKAAHFETLRQSVKLVRYGIDCYAFVLLALGLVDIAMETGVDDHDVVALVPLIEAAGGRVTDWHGWRAVGGGDVVAVGDARLLEPVLRLLT